MCQWISHTLARTRIPSYAIEIKGNTFISSEIRFVHARAISLPFKKNTTGSLPFLTPLKSTSHAMRSPRYAIASEKEDFFDCESKVACDAWQYWMAPVECQLPIWVVDQLICVVPTPWPDRSETRRNLYSIAKAAIFIFNLWLKPKQQNAVNWLNALKVY